MCEDAYFAEQLGNNDYIIGYLENRVEDLTEQIERLQDALRAAGLSGAHIDAITFGRIV
jgi:hypothetical protein